MHFQRLRLTGFKSFVEPADFRIEPGLTGIVGPNGCGKSNLLEAMRWVMGANSAKAMRAGGMDDVIFNGAGRRPARNSAEVILTIDNADRGAPAAFNDDPVIEVSRRIDRGSGSAYKINGREVRARDVQLLFADASTGANSPALVRQGQISELIAAKPQNRRRLLEEAAGVSGLHTRRHDADLRLKAADANLARLDEVTRELDTQVAKLRREARQAEKYRGLSADIRSLQDALAYSRWTQARDQKQKAEEDLARASLEVEAATRLVVTANTEMLQANEALAPLREEAATANAVLNHLAIERDRVEREIEATASELTRLEGERQRLDDDRSRETDMAGEAMRNLRRLRDGLSEVQIAIEQAPERIPELEKLYLLRESERQAADSGVEVLVTALARAESVRRALDARQAEARQRLARAEAAKSQAIRDLAALTPVSTDDLATLKTAVDTGAENLESARSALARSETSRADAAGREAEARLALRAAEDEFGRLRAEARGLAQLSASSPKNRHKPVLELIEPGNGLEIALAAALGDDLDAALEHEALAFWAGKSVSEIDWPPGATCLLALMTAPEALHARLAMTALVDPNLGPQLQTLLPPGARLVSRLGDLWRWDGYTQRREAPRPTAIRLEQKSRLRALELQIETLEPQVKLASEALKACGQIVATCEQAVKQARATVPGAEIALNTARDRLLALQRDADRQDAKLQTARAAVDRTTADLTEIESLLIQIEGEERPDPEFEASTSIALEGARALANQARAAAQEASTAVRLERQQMEARLRRQAGLTREIDDWVKREATARARIETLALDRVATEVALDRARSAPDEARLRGEKLLDAFRAAETRRIAASDALTLAEDLRQRTDQQLRHAESAASDCRETRAAAQAKLDSARERLMQLTGDLRDSTRLEPEALGIRLAAGAVAVPTEIGGVEQHLQALERERDLMGAVNLRASEELDEVNARLQALGMERADLTGAVSRLRQAIEALNAEGRERLLAAFDIIHDHFRDLFTTLFSGGEAELKLVESDDPLEAGLEIYACPPGKRLSAMSLMSGGEQALTATALIFAVFLSNPAPVCVLDEVDAPLDDANVERFCDLLDSMVSRTRTRFITITHNAVTMSRMNRLFGVTMAEQGISRLVSVDLGEAASLVLQ